MPVTGMETVRVEMAGPRSGQPDARQSPEEEVVRVGREPTVLKETQQVMELAMDIAHNLEWSFELEQRRLILHDLLSRLDEEGDVIGRQGNGGPWFLC